MAKKAEFEFKIVEHCLQLFNEALSKEKSFDKL